MTAMNEINQRFTDAWADLHERITRGLDNLTVLAENTAANRDPQNPRDDDARHERLTRKTQGLDQALTLWENLNTTIPRDGAAAWRTFTDQVYALWQAEPGADVKQGLALALDYQRGYGPDVDAPPLIALAATQGTKALR